MDRQQKKGRFAVTNDEHIGVLQQGVEAWNQWRVKNVGVEPQLSRAELSGVDLSGANLTNADLFEAELTGANLSDANLHGVSLEEAELTDATMTGALLDEANLSSTTLARADLSKIYAYRADLGRANLSRAVMAEAHLFGAYLYGADLDGANLAGANLSEANLSESTLVSTNLTDSDMSGALFRRADLSGADLSRANLTGAALLSTKLNGAKLTSSQIHGVAAWNIEISPDTEQSGLVVTPKEDAAITVDSIEVAQFVYLLLSNENVRQVIDTVGKKGVLILGRFTPERKAVLDVLKDALHENDFLPIVFDFDKPTERDFTETIMILAGLSRFVIADITNPKSSPLELQATVPNYMIPIVPIIQEGEQPFSMFRDLQNKYAWVLDALKYDSLENLVAKLEPAVIQPALQKAEEMAASRIQPQRTRHLSDY